MKDFKTALVSAFVLLVVLAMSGCFTLSVHPLYFEADLVFDAGLEGTWGEKEKEKDLSELWIFKRSGEKSYRLLIKDKESGEGEFEAHLLKLGKHTFLDLYPEEPETGNDFFKSHVIPAHSFMRISLEGHVMQIAFLDSTWLQKGIDSGKIAIKHERRDDMIVLTASTRELQEFVLKHVEEAFVFEQNPLHRYW